MLKNTLVAVALACGALGATQAQPLPQSPAELARTFERHFNARDVESLMKLYAPGSVFIPAPGVELREPAQVRGALNQFLSTGLPLQFKVRHIYRTGATALIVLDWLMEGTGPDGKPLKMAGTGADVVAQQADGSWQYVIDNPFGVAAAQP